MMAGCSPPMAFVLSWVVAWKAVGTEMAVKRLWDTAAYATRAGRVSLREALSLDARSLAGFLGAVSDLIEQENRAGDTSSLR
jgi:hypothetical protein